MTIKSVLKKKKVLITAGPSWVAIDDVRVISNISTGELGVLLAQQAARFGAKVDLFLGPVQSRVLAKKIKHFRFVYFDELLDLIQKRLKKTNYDIIFHAAAVSDYIFKGVRGKISSEKKYLTLKLRRAPKIIKTIRRLNPKAFLVMFKLESGISDQILFKRSATAAKSAGADLVVANIFKNKRYKGFILDHDRLLAKADSRQELAKKLFAILKQKIFS